MEKEKQTNTHDNIPNLHSAKKKFYTLDEINRS